MDNKTKVKVAIVIGIIILAVIFILMVIFVKGNRTPVNKNIPTKTSKTYTRKDENTSEDKASSEYKNEEFKLDEIVSIGIKDKQFVGIDKDLKFANIKKLKTGYISYCIGKDDDNICIYELYKDEEMKIVKIDLSENDFSEKEIFSSNEYKSIDNLRYYSGKIYFVSDKKQLIEYSIEEDFTKKLTEEDEVSSFEVDSSKNILYVSYEPNGENPGIYTFDFTSNEFSQIIALNELAGELGLKDNSLIIDVKQDNKLYDYDCNSNTITEIGDKKLSKLSSQITFYGNYLVYTDGKKIDIRQSNGESYQDDFYIIEDSSISEISMIGEEKLQIVKEDNEGNVNGSIVIDLAGGIVKENDIEYTDLILLTNIK